MLVIKRNARQKFHRDENLETANAVNQVDSGPSQQQPLKNAINERSSTNPSAGVSSSKRKIGMKSSSLKSMLSEKDYVNIFIQGDATVVCSIGPPLESDIQCKRREDRA